MYTLINATKYTPAVSFPTSLEEIKSIAKDAKDAISKIASFALKWTLFIPHTLYKLVKPIDPEKVENITEKVSQPMTDSQNSTETTPELESNSDSKDTKTEETKSENNSVSDTSEKENLASKQDPQVTSSQKTEIEKFVEENMDPAIAAAALLNAASWTTTIFKRTPLSFAVSTVISAATTGAGFHFQKEIESSNIVKYGKKQVQAQQAPNVQKNELGERANTQHPS